jgi:hypothetical protein
MLRNVPPLHGIGLDEVPRGQTLPAGHSRFVKLYSPKLLQANPAGQAVQFCKFQAASAGFRVPGGHGIAALLAGQYDPGGHGIGTGSPAVQPKPCGQDVQSSAALAPTVARKVPVGHTAGNVVASVQ